jgi:cobalt-zinc-cadmium efflux system protein
LAHDHSRQHHHDFRRAFAVGIVLNLAFVLVEATAGVLSGSLALITDAGHNLSDVLGLVMAWAAVLLSARRASGRRTYGWRKSSILAALMNAILLLFAIGAVAWEAIRRIGHPAPVDGRTIILVAAIGLVVNGATALFFRHGRGRDLNVRGAFLHMAADAAVSAGVVVSGIIISLTGWMWLDPAVSLGIVVVILIGTWGLLRESFNLALDAVPPGIEPETVRGYLCALPGVTAVHDLHIWGMSTTEIALTAHLVKPDPADDDALVARAARELRERFGVGHVTLQWERVPEAAECEPCGEG